MPTKRETDAERIQGHNRIAANRWLCAVKKHRATSLHYDFRIRFENALLSWVLRDGPSYCAGERRIAIEVEDHNPLYLTSERLILPGNRGAGPVMLWDVGFLILHIGFEDIRECLRRGRLSFTLECEKLKGDWTLERRSDSCQMGTRPIWDLIKESDAFARANDTPCVLIQFPNSVRTGDTLEEIEQKVSKGKRKLVSQASLFANEETNLKLG